MSITQSYESKEYILGCAKEHLSLWDWVVDLFQSALYFIIMKAITLKDEKFYDINHIYDGEEWRDVIGYEGFYQVSNYGRVKSIERDVWSGNVYYKKSEKLKALIVGKDRYAYSKVHLYKYNKRKFALVHRLVAMAFLNTLQKETVNHIDGIKLNNHISNLEWSTYGDNNRHAFSNGLMNPIKGTEVHCSKLNSKKVRRIRGMLSSGFSQRKVAELMGISRGPIQRIAEGTGWKHVK